MSVKVNMQTQNVGTAFIKRTAGILGNVSKSYVKSAMPTVTSTFSDVKSEVVKIRASTTGIAENAARLKSSNVFRSVFQWYMGAEEEYSSDLGSALNYDIPTDDNTSADETPSASFSKTYTEQSNANANKIAGAVVKSSMKLAEAQLGSTAEVVSSIQHLEGSVVSGFKDTNDLLGKILDVLTKNTAALVESNIALVAAQSDPGRDMQRDGRFSISGYKSIVSNNVKNNPVLGMLSAYLPMLKDGNLLKGIGPEEVLGTGLSLLLGKVAPGIEKSMKSLDNAINDAIMKSLVRLGQTEGDGIPAQVARLLGIDSTRKSVDTSKSTLELKSVSFDSMTKEAITGAIPGYLRKILVALGGDDAIYDYRSRKFTTRKAIRKEFRENLAITGSINSTSKMTKRTFGNDEFGQMMYDLMMADMGGDAGSRSAMNRKKNIFKNQDQAVEYMKQLLGGGRFSDDDIARLSKIAANLSKSSSNGVLDDMEYQAARHNIRRQSNMERYVKEANAYNIDLSGFEDTVKEELSAIRRQYGRMPDHGGPDASVQNKNVPLTGLKYTNNALYHIFKRLDTGLNVYVSGFSSKQTAPYASMLMELPPPAGIRKIAPKIPRTGGTGPNPNNGEEAPNMLLEEQDEEGNELTTGDRVKRWGKQRGSQFISAIKNRNPDQIQNVISSSIGDIGGVISDQIKKGAGKINTEFGNISGYLRHKLTGAEYSYIDGDEKVTVKASEKGGILGFVKDEFKDSFAKVKEKGSKWFSQVSKWFDYSDPNDKDANKPDVVKKRSRFISASIGAFAGAGLLGGPIGLILGGIAGHAIGGMDLQGKIKNLLFGYDDSDQAKATGILSKFADKVVSPIQFQIEKTMAKASYVLKKNILGPLSDIGFAIKERAKKAADATFGKAFRFIGKVITAPFRGIKNVFFKTVTGTFTLMNKLFRVGMGAQGAAAGGILGGIASIINPKDSKDALKDRRKARNAELKDELNNGIYRMKYKDYRKQKRISRRDRLNRLSDYTDAPEEVIRESIDVQESMDQHAEEISDNVKNMSEVQNKQADEISELVDHATHTDGEHSIFTHDHGVHQYLERIIEIISGKGDPGKKKLTKKIDANSPEAKASIDHSKSKFPIPAIPTAKSEKAADPTDSDDYANAALSAIASIGASNGTFSKDEAEIAKSAVSEASKNNSSKSSMKNALVDMINTQEQKGEEIEKEKEDEPSFFEKLLTGAADILGGGLTSVLKTAAPWLLGALGIGWLLDVNWDDVKAFGSGVLDFFGGAKSVIDGIGNWVGNIGEGFSDLLAFFGIGNGKQKGKDATDAGINAALSFADTQVESKTDLVNPMADLVHIDTDAAGNNVTNASATHAKNEVLYFQNARKEFGYGKAWNTIRTESNLNKAAKFEAKANAAASKATAASSTGTLKGKVSAAYNNAKAKGYQSKADSYLNKAIDGENDTEALAGSTGRGIVKQAARLGTLTMLSKGAGSAVSGIAKAAGVNEETADIAGNVAETGVAAGLTVNTIKSAAKGKNSIVDNILALLKKAFDFLAGKFKGVAALKGAASKVDDVFSKIMNALSPARFTDDIIKKIGEKLGINLTKQTAAMLSAGIGIAVGGIVGAISGACSVEHLFGVLPGDADAKMTAISSAMQAVFGALEMVPGIGCAVLVLDVVDPIVQAVLKYGLKQFIARNLYKAMGGDLEELDAKFNAEKDYYNQTYGANVDTATFNDMVNRTGIIDTIWHGKQQYGEDGHLKFDAAGGTISNGLQQLFVGGEKDYAKDENGNVIRTADGTAVVKKDAYGATVKVDEKWGDKFGKAGNRVGHFITGGVVYKTDENGNALVDPETGEYIVDHTEKNIIGKAGDALSTAGKGIVSAGKAAGSAVVNTVKAAGTGLKNLGSAAVDKAKAAGSAVLNAGKAAGSAISGGLNKIGSWLGIGGKDKEEDTDVKNKAKEVKAENDKQSSEIINAAKKVSGGILSFLKNPVETTKKAVEKINKDDEEYDENGNLITKGTATIKNVLKKGIGTITSIFKKPAEEAEEFAKESENSDKPVLNSDGTVQYSKEGDTKSTGIGGFLTNALKGVKNVLMKPAEEVAEMIREENGEKYEKDANGNVISDLSKSTTSTTGSPLKKGDFGNFIKTGLGKLASFITKPFNDMIKSAEEWDTKDSPWATDRSTSTGSNSSSKSAFSWIKGKITSLWGNITNSISNASSSSNRTNATSTSYVGGGIGSPESDSASTTDALSSLGFSTTSSAAASGGNPLTKPFRVTSAYGNRNLGSGSEFHKGIDIVPQDGSGQADISARYAGRVVSIEKNIPDSHTGLKVSSQTTGNYVTVETPDGQNRIKYFHMKAGSIPSGITKGSNINVGDKIGSMGSTGRSTGPHLHYQLEKKDANGNFQTYDPYPDISGSGANGSSINSTSDFSLTDDSSSSDSSSSGPLGQLVTKLKSLGTEFLAKITGGLFGADGDGTSTGDSSGTGGYSVDQFLAMCAAEIGTAEDPDGSNNVKYNTWYYGHEVSGAAYPWCMAFVQWCFNNAGLTLEHKSASCADMLSWYKSNHPDMVHDTPEKGDIMIQSGHTGIVESVNGDSVGTIEGNTSNAVARRTQPMSSIVGFIRPVDWDSLASIGDFGNVDTSIGGLWNYAKSIGFNDFGAAGVLGCWENESANNPKRVEGDYLNIFKSTFGTGDQAYIKAGNDRALLDSYTVKLFGKYGGGINRSAYEGGDGHKYPGLGYAQWTGPRGKTLLETAKKSNTQWFNPAYQLSFANMEMTDPSNYRGPNGTDPKGKLAKVSSPEDAADTFCYYYEGIKGDQKRRNSARKLYNTYAGKGGPIDDPMDALSPYIGGSVAEDVDLHDGVGGPINKEAVKFKAAKRTFLRENRASDLALRNAAGIARQQIGKQKPVQGIGGPIETPQRSSYTTVTTPRQKSTVTDHSIPTPRQVISVENVGGPGIAPNDGDMTKVMQLLSQAVAYLRSISANTGDSVSYLDAINGKEFVDQGVRDTLNALGNSKSRKATTPSSGSSRTATQLARP